MKYVKETNNFDPNGWVAKNPEIFSNCNPFDSVSRRYIGFGCKILDIDKRTTSLRTYLMLDILALDNKKYILYIPIEGMAPFQIGKTYIFMNSIDCFSTNNRIYEYQAPIFKFYYYEVN